MVVWLGVLVGLLTVGAGAVSDFFCWLLGLFSSYWVALSSLKRKVDAYSYHKVICYN